ncbi:hypothetical protein CDAR_302811 [Caerostris darwini]|uniref:Uncharacterized protein n=1 Tax=Caerostris darwini TaxID=1538125 RepID=A0AAV4V403_9ARAC|nr:hypothetical protein CDAR_302811 [Caerostris darwini]
MSEMWTKSPNWGMQEIEILHEQGNTAGTICINRNVKGCVASRKGYSAFPKSQMKIKQSQVNTSFTPKSMIAQKHQLFKILSQIINVNSQTSTTPASVNIFYTENNQPLVSTKVSRESFNL